MAYQVADAQSRWRPARPGASAVAGDRGRGVALGLGGRGGRPVARQERRFRADSPTRGQHARGGARAQRVARGDARGAVHAGPGGVDRRGAGGGESRVAGACVGSAAECGARVVVLDACGVGELPDAAEYGDAGSNTLAHLAEQVGGLRLPTLERLGLGSIVPLSGVPPAPTPAVHGRLRPLGPGKESTTGHWELMGVVPERPLPTYPHGLPARGHAGARGRHRAALLLQQARTAAPR